LIEIREESRADFAAIRELNDSAFGQGQEGRIIEALRLSDAVLLSLVATLDGNVVAHILYSPASIEGEVTGAALGPMAVKPQHQRCGFGGKLVAEGSRRLKDAGCPFIILIGHSDYYPRFGFRPASTHGIKCEWDVPDEAFMLLILDEAKMRGVSGLAKFRPEFTTVT
jgi:putative acetyltransferase